MRLTYYICTSFYKNGSCPKQVLGIDVFCHIDAPEKICLKYGKMPL